MDRNIRNALADRSSVATGAPGGLGGHDGLPAVSVHSQKKGLQFPPHSDSPRKNGSIGEMPRSAHPVRPAIRQFDIFLKVVEARSFTDVAHQFGVSPSAIAQSIARLEEIYGGELFIRNRRAPLDLTPLGKQILPSARKTVDIIDHQMAIATAIATSQIGTLSVGFYPHIAFGPLRDGLADFIAQCPDVKLQFVEAPPGTLYRHLNCRKIDVMFTAFFPEMTTPTLMRESLWREQLHAVFPKGHPTARKRRCSWADVSSLPIILCSHPADCRTLIQHVGHRLDWEQHDVSLGPLFEMVALGLGTTIAFKSACLNRHGIISRPIVGEESAVAVEAIWLTSDANPIRHRLIRHVRERAATR